MIRAIIGALAAAAFMGLAAPAPAQAGMLNPGLNAAAVNTGLNTAGAAKVQNVHWRGRYYRHRGWYRRHHWRRPHRVCRTTWRWRYGHRVPVRRCYWRRW